MHNKFCIIDAKTKTKRSVRQYFFQHYLVMLMETFRAQS